MGGSQSILKKFDEKQLIAVYHSPDAKVIRTRSRKPIKPAPKSAQKIELHAELMQGQNNSMMSVIDGTTQVPKTAKWPNSAHGVIAFKMNNIGVGIMIGPQIVLTAGSNLYDVGTKTYVDPESMQFLPGMNGNTAPFGAIEVERRFVSPNYIKEGKDDYGILILKKPIGDETGYFGLACLESEEIEEEKKTNVAEYPGDKVKDKPSISNISEREGETSTIYKTQGSLNSSTIDMYNGQNGSGVWYKEGGHYYVCGIHRAGNAATLLTRDIYKQICTWIGDAGLKELLFESRELCFYAPRINANFVAFLIKEDFNDLITLNFIFGEIANKELEKLTRDTSWMNLSELVLKKSKIDAEGAKVLAQNTSWINLSKLNLYYNKIGAGAKALAQNTSWANLSELCLTGNNIDPEGAKGLGQNTSWVNLSQLSLTQNSIGAEGAKGLGQNTSWVNLSQLMFFSNNIGAEGAKGLAQNTSWVNLSQLALDDNNIGSEGAKGLAQNTSWANLSVLGLGGNNIDAEGAKGLAQNTSWINLSKLDLHNNKIDAEGAKALAQNPTWIRLTELDLSYCHLDCRAAEELAKNESWINLSVLNLRENRIGAEGAKGLAQNTSWINLSKLILTKNDLGSEGAGALAKNVSWIKLKELDLQLNKICEKGVKALAQNISWINLSDLNLLYNRVERKGVDVIKENKVWGQKFNFAAFEIEEKVEEVEDERENIRYWKG